MGISKKDGMSVLAAAFFGAAALGAPVFYVGNMVNEAQMDRCFDKQPADFVCVQNVFNARVYNTVAGLSMMVIGMGAGAALAWPRKTPGDRGPDGGI